MSQKPQVHLARYDNSDFDPGAGPMARAVWYLVNELVIRNRLNPFSRLRVALLRAFGAKIGAGVVIKPGVNVKYPWNLTIGDHTWVGEGAWLDSLTTIRIGSDCCVSQGAYLCTGNHDWADPAFALIVKPIVIEDGAWVAAKAVVLPGVTLGDHGILTAGSVASKNTEPRGIYRGNPAQRVGERTIRG